MGRHRGHEPDRAEQLTKQLKGPAEFVVKDSFGYALSADGSKMVITVHDGQSGRVMAANADGSAPQFVAPHLGYIYMARLSPGNDRVVFSGPARGYRLLSAALPDGKPTELTPDHPECFVPQFTPDGKTVVFIRRDGDVYRVDADGKHFKRLTEGNQYVEFKLSPKDRHGSTDGPDIAPDGKRIAFVARKDGVPNVFVMDLDGGNRRQITARNTACGRVRWSPDGTQLAFVSFEGKYPQLFVVPATGGEPRQLTKLDGAVYYVNWSRGAIPEKKPNDEAVTVVHDLRYRDGASTQWRLDLAWKRELLGNQSFAFIARHGEDLLETAHHTNPKRQRGNTPALADASGSCPR